MKYILAGLTVLLLVCIVALVCSLPVMLLWNWIMPELFSLKPVSWLQALGLLVLSGLLFRGTGAISGDKK